MHRHAAAAGLGILLWTGGPSASIGSERSARIERLGPATKAAHVLGGGLSSGFEANAGHLDARMDFVARLGKLMVYLSAGDVLLRVPDRAQLLHMTLVGRNRQPRVQPQDRLPAIANYFRGSDPRKWHTSISTYSRVRYASVYRGIDLIYYFDGKGQLEHDFLVAPGANPRSIRFRIDGAREVRIDSDGNLQLRMTDGAVTLRKPVMYQVSGDERHSIAGRYAMKGQRDIGFEIGSYDRMRPLWIDPVVYATYLGGIGTDEASDVAVDAQGNVYVTGVTQSVDFPSANAWQPQLNGWKDAFVAKFDASGTLQYSTYLGGSGSDEGRAISVDGGVVYVAGVTSKAYGLPADFPTTPGAFQTVGSGNDAFIARIGATGALVAATLFGGMNDDAATGIAIDAGGNPYIVGITASPDLPLRSPLQPAYRGSHDAFAAKLNAGLTAVEYSTFVGGAGVDEGYGAAVDAEGNLTIVGATSSGDFPTASAFQPSRAGWSDAFVTKLNAAGSAFVFSTYFGGALPDLGGDEEATAVAIDAEGDVVFGGATNSTDLPGAGDSAISGPPHPINGGYELDAFVAKLSATGALAFSTYVGGNHEDTVADLALDAAGSIYITGGTYSTSLPQADDRLADVGAFRSINGGSSWTAVTGGLDSASITALAVDPSAPSTLYAGTDRDGVFKSTDGGVSWSRSSQGLWWPFITKLVIDPVNPSTVYAATYGGGKVFKSIDAGANWKSASSGIEVPLAISLAIAPSNPSILYVGTVYRGYQRLYRTIDGGATWNLVTYLWVSAIAVDPSTSSTAYAAASVNLYKTVDDGTTWSKVFTESTHLAPLSAVLIDPSSPSTVYVGTTGKGVFKSADAGATWVAASTGLTGGNVSTLALDPGNPATLYAGMYDRGVFKSTDGGATWSASNAGIADVQVTEIAVDPQAPGTVHVGAHGLYGDGYLAILTAQGTIGYSTHAGGSRRDAGLGVAATRAGTAHLAGLTGSRDWPTRSDALRPQYGGGYTDGFVSRFACVAPLAFSPIRVNRSVLWPPDHRMVPVSLGYEVAGACGALACGLTVASDEPVNGIGDGDAEPDWQVIDARNVRLRAERAGNGGGRTYTLTVRCSDESGQEAVRSQTVIVPVNYR